MGAGALREVVYFERREMVQDEYGNTQDNWIRFAPPEGRIIAARIQTIRANEELIAGRATSVGQYKATLRYSSLTRDIGTRDRLINARGGIKYNILAVMPDERRRYIFLQIEKGGPTG